MIHSVRADEYPSLLIIGEGRVLDFTAWLAEDGVRYIIGAIETHPSPKTRKACMGHIYFDVHELPPDIAGESPRWDVESFSPLTLSPSILCRGCGNHGYIREGKWVPA